MLPCSPINPTTSVRGSPEFSTAPPEHALLLAAAGVSGGSRDAVGRALAAPLDWTRVIELTLRHRMAPALLVALERADAAVVPSDILAALRDHCTTLRRQSRALVAELFALLDALDARSIAAIPFKGPLLGELLFGDAGLRSPGDLDLLVRHADVDAVRDVLEGRGYVDADQRLGTPSMTPTQRRMYEQFQCEYLYIRDSDAVVVEPHWGLSQRPLAIDVDYAAMLDRAAPAELGGRSVLVLDPADQLLALCIHGAKHRWNCLAWIRDVAGAIRKYPGQDLDACVAQAGRFGCERILLLGLALAGDCAQAPLPPLVVQAIEAARGLARLREEVIAGLFAPAKPEPRNDRIDRFRLRMRERWTDRARYVARTWTTPRRHHIETVALPSSLSWAYRPLKMVLDYAVLPLWQLRSGRR